MTERTRQLVADFYASRLTNDVDAVMTWYLPDAEALYIGSEAVSKVADAASGPALSDLLRDVVETWNWLKQEVDDLVVEGDRAAIRYRATIRHTPTNRELTVDLIDFVTFEDGKVRRFVEMPDTAVLTAFS